MGDGCHGTRGRKSKKQPHRNRRNEQLISPTALESSYKTSTLVTFTLPSTFNPVDCLPQRLHRHADAARWLVSTIVTRMAAKDIDSWACVRIECETLIQIMGKRALDIVTALEDADVIQTAPRRGETTIGFRMHGNYCERSHRVPCQNARLAGRIARLRSREP